jgi:hypothetical protein
MTGFSVLRGVDGDGTGEVLLVGVVRDTIGNHVICSDDHGRDSDVSTEPEHIPIKISLNQQAGLRCNGVGRFDESQEMTLTFAVFEVDDVTFISDMLDYVLTALDLVAQLPVGAAAMKGIPHLDKALFIANMINFGLEKTGILRSVDLIGVYHMPIGPSLDYTQQGHESADQSLRFYYHTSPVLNPATHPEPVPPLETPRHGKPGLEKILLPEQFYVCQREPGQESCLQKGGLYLRSTPCALDNVSMKKGGNIKMTVRNGSYVERTQTDFFPSACPDNQDDQVIQWMYIRTEDGDEGYMSASFKYLIPVFE